MRRLETTYSTLRWSDDGSLVTKTRPANAEARQRFRNELRVSRLVTAYRPPVCTPALVAHDRQRRSLTFEALAAEPLGPKYPTDLSTDQIGALVAIADALDAYRPRRRWFRGLDAPRRVERAHRAGLLGAGEASRLIGPAQRAQKRLQFAHGDITARNALVVDDGLALIDWEWAGLYPRGYDHAFLWFSLVDTARGRDIVEQRLLVDEEPFLLNALLIQLWHLEWFVPAEFRAKHLATRDDLLARLGCA